MNLVSILSKYIIFIIITNTIVFKVQSNCMQATKEAELAYQIPKGLLTAISFAETGRTLKNGKQTSWPWTVNLGGKGKFFPNKKSAVDYVKENIKKGKKNIDIGCMQVNMKYHPKAFKSLEDAFDPKINTLWAAAWLKTLQKSHNSWREATGYYHSSRPKRKKIYSGKVFDLWASLENNTNLEKKLVVHNIKNGNLIDNIIAAKSSTQIMTKNKILPINEIKNIAIMNKDNKNKKENVVSSPYIVARMEKVRFFRKYFNKNNN